MSSDSNESNALAVFEKQLADFAKARDWEQFHSPKNLVMALTGEVGELVEHFQWLTEEQSKTLPVETLREVSLEMADVFIYLLRLSERLQVDLLGVAKEKMALNEKRYPADQVRGSAKRAAEYQPKTGR